MPVDELQRVRDADPVTSPPAAPALAQLRHRIEQQGERPPRRGSSRTRLAAVVATSVAVAITMLAWPSERVDVLAAVYNAATPRTGTLHIESRTIRRQDGVLLSTSHESIWTQPAEGRSRTVTKRRDHRTGRVTRSEITTSPKLARWWTSRRPGFIREIRSSAQIAAPDGNVSLLRWLYRGKGLQLVGPAKAGHWELRGQPSPHSRMVALVDAKSLIPVQITQTDDVKGGPIVTDTRYGTFRHEPGDVTLAMPDHRGLPIKGTRPTGPHP